MEVNVGTPAYIPNHHIQPRGATYITLTDWVIIINNKVADLPVRPEQTIIQITGGLTKRKAEQVGRVLGLATIHENEWGWLPGSNKGVFQRALAKHDKIMGFL